MTIEYVKEIGAKSEVYLFCNSKVLINGNVFIVKGAGSSIPEGPGSVPEL